MKVLDKIIANDTTPNFINVMWLKTQYGVEPSLNANINGEWFRIGENNTIPMEKISEINAKIPEAATPENQLADKQYVSDFVDRSLGTFLGTSEPELTEEQFLAWADSLEPIENDFVYWDTVDSSENNVYKRYQYNGINWVFQYDLNNSSFTEAEMAAIQSGITATKVAQHDAKADRDTDAVVGNIAMFDATGNAVDAGEHINNIKYIARDFGRYASSSNVTLVKDISGKYIDKDTAKPVANASYAISTSIALTKGDILLIPSASAVLAACSVVSRVVTRTYNKVIVYTYTYDETDPTLYSTATADYDQTIVYTASYDLSDVTPVFLGWIRDGQTYQTLPATREVTESYYEPLFKQAVAAMPDTGYYVYLCPETMNVVISGLTATVDGGIAIKVGWGIFKNIVSNFLSMPGQNALAQSLCDLDARINGIADYIKNIRNIDLENQPKICGADWTISCTGAPTFGAMFVGQWCHATIESKVNIYRSISVTNSASDWVLVAVQS